MIDEIMILGRIEDLIEQIGHTAREAEHLRELQLLRGQQEFTDADQRASEERTREQARALIHGIEGSLTEGHPRDALVFCRQLRNVLGLIEQPDLPPADTAGGK